MGELVLKGANMRIGTSGAAVNLSDHLRSVTITYSAEIHDRTAMGSSGRKRLAGLKDWTAALEFNQDYAAGKVDATLFGYVGSTAKWFTIKPTSAAAGATNPRFYGNFLLPEYNPIVGAAGDLSTLTVTLQGDGILNRTTSSTA